MQPSEGTARVAGHDVVDEPQAVQQVLGYLPENAPLYLDMTVQEYLQMMAELRGVSDADKRRYLSEAVHATGLRQHLTKPIGSLSKGYRQRVGLAQAIVHDPKLVVLDEPTVGLDPNQIVEIREVLREIGERNTVILSSHILSEVEATCLALPAFDAARPENQADAPDE